MVAIHKPAHDIIIKPVVSERLTLIPIAVSTHLRGGSNR